MNITPEDIESITTAVWSTMLDSEISPDPSIDAESLAASHVGLIRLEGDFQGVISVHLTEGLVRGAASVMFGLPARDVDAEQMRDTVAELTNMVGGNVKCLLEGQTKLGLPTVVPPADAGDHLGGARVTASRAFAAPNGGVVVVVHAR